MKATQMANNQIIIQSHDGQYFQSYDSIIAYRDVDGQLTLDRDNWNYSKTTAKYRNLFTGLTTKATLSAISAGTIKLEDLNNESKADAK